MGAEIGRPRPTQSIDVFYPGTRSCSKQEIVVHIFVDGGVRLLALVVWTVFGDFFEFSKISVVLTTTRY